MFSGNARSPGNGMDVCAVAVATPKVTRITAREEMCRSWFILMLESP